MRCRAKLRLVFVVCCCLCQVVCAQVGPDGAGGSTATQKLDAALDQAALGGEGYERARWRLERLPLEEAIPQIVAALSKPGVAQNEESRRLAYAMLALHDAARTSIGREQLIRGLGDVSTRIQQICCEALDPATVGRELASVVAQINDSNNGVSQRQVAIRRLGGWGRYASAAFDLMVGIYKNPSEDEKLRGDAAVAMLRIGGLPQAWGQFADLDPVGEKLRLWALVGYIAQSTSYGRTLGPDELKHLPMAREYVIKAMVSNDVDIRQAALEGLMPVFGENWIVVRSRNDYEMNPQFRKALEYMATNDPNEALRQRAGKGIAQIEDRMDRAAENILRERREKNQHDAPNNG